LLKYNEGQVEKKEDEKAEEEAQSQPQMIEIHLCMQGPAGV
jgi:hypothetical protein